MSVQIKESLNHHKIGRPSKKSSELKNTNSRKANRVVLTLSENNVQTHTPQSRAVSAFGGASIKAFLNRRSLPVVKRMESQNGNYQSEFLYTKRINSLDEDSPSSPLLLSRIETEEDQGNMLSSRRENFAEKTSCIKLNKQEKDTRESDRAEEMMTRKRWTTHQEDACHLKNQIEKLSKKNELLQKENVRLKNVVELNESKRMNQSNSTRKKSHQDDSQKEYWERNEDAWDMRLKCNENIPIVFSQEKNIVEPVREPSLIRSRRLIASLKEEIRLLKNEVHPLQQHIEFLSKEKKDLQVQQIHQMLDQERENKAALQTLQDAIVNLNDYIDTLKDEISELRSYKGLNAKAPVFNPTTAFQYNYDNRLTAETSPQQAVYQSNISQTLAFPGMASLAIYGPQSAPNVQESDIHSNAHIMNNHSILKEADPQQQQDHLFADIPGESGGWGNSKQQQSSVEPCSETPPPPIQQQPSTRKSRRKKRRRRERSRRAKEDEKKYIVMNSATNNAKKGQNHNTDGTGGSRRKVIEIKSKSHTQISGNNIKYGQRSNLHQHNSQSQQRSVPTLKGLMMGPHDPSHSCPPVVAVPPNKKKNKRNYYRRNKGK